MDYSTRLPPRKRLLAEIKIAQNSDCPDDSPFDTPPILPSQFHSGELRTRIQSLLDHRHSSAEEFAEASTLVALAADRIAADARAGALQKAEIAARVKSFAKSVLEAAASAAEAAAPTEDDRVPPETRRRSVENNRSSSLQEDGGDRSNGMKHRFSAASLKENKGRSAKSNRSALLEEEGGDLGISPTVEVIKKGRLRKKRVLLSRFCGDDEGNKAISNSKLSSANSDSVASNVSDGNESILKPKKLKLSGFYKEENIGAAASIHLKQRG